MVLKLIANNPYPQFGVYDEERLVASTKIDNQIKALRIICEDKRRVFFITEEKVRKESICSLVNEYSQQLGTLTKDKFANNSGEIRIEGLKLNYRITSNPVKEIVLLEKNNPHALLNCRVSDAVILEYGDYINYFLFTLSWYTFLHAKKKEEMHFA